MSKTVVVDFRYSNRIAVGVDNAKRTEKTPKGIRGKRPTYRGTDKPRTRKQKAKRFERWRPRRRKT
jgi:hypothetical protein